MAGDGIEEGLESATSPLLPGEKSTSSSATRNQHSITPVLVCSTLVALCGSFTYGCSVGYSSPAESGIMEDLGLSVSAYSFFGSIVTIGGMVGAILSGKMADLVGRRGTMWACQIICMAGWLAIAFAKKAWCLDIGRFLVGVAIGILTYVVPVYISEITPKHLRGRFTSANQLLVCCGFAVTYFVGSIVSWRALSLIATIPSILQIVCLFFVPESPRWLAKLGRQKEFEASLQRLRGAESDISEEAVDIRDAIEILKQTSAETRTLELFQRRYAYVIIVGEGLILLQTFGGNSAVSYYLGTIFAKANSNIYCNCTVNGFIRKTDTSYGFSDYIMLMLVPCRIIVLLPGIQQSERAHSNIDFGWHIGFWNRFHHRHVRNTLGYNGRDISRKCQGISRKPNGSNQLG
ncbi:hypothetical protein OIU79_018487 [Salix purpurea]|uniref:Major facilitator superfamily (MFS) profile domain-containing protein n=1 Tax=Salix purpurea TaxID=77065 RepID=A0A9Q0WXG4_SALPP|nr:hypothetical protein OIU79_018487 [Salix purpurea]